MTGLVARSGIWTPHFVAMLAFGTGLPTGYRALATMGSLPVAIVSTGLGFVAGSARLASTRPWLASIVGGLIVGLGVAAMHDVGMAGLRPWDGMIWS